MFSLSMFFSVFLFKGVLLMFRLKNVLMMLFAIEFITVKLLFTFMYLSTPFDPVSLLIFLAVAAGEASMGLSLMIAVLRQSGKDNLIIPV